MWGQSAAQAIAWGMVPGGGLFVPTVIPPMDWAQLRGLTYSEVARRVMGQFLAGIDEEAMNQAWAVYREGVFDSPNPAPLVHVGDFGVLELWHGPTAAFKDMALQVLPYFLAASVREVNQAAQVLILVATSGDTGKAALEGFKNVPGTQIMVFYPDGGVSPVQERQMTTTNGHNTFVTAVKGNFDRCQSAVKEIFGSADLQKRLQAKNMMFSSANSINWGRLLPQIVYYIWTYLQAVQTGKIEAGQPVNVVVPTGNFGNILAAYYAQRMGLPIGRMICASNKNKVLSDFFNTGVYDIQRPFYLTMAPSMDILISSNFERFLYEMNGRDAEQVVRWFKDLTDRGKFEVDAGTLRACRDSMYTGWADEDDVLQTIGNWYRDTGYVFDTHTAVGVKVYEDYRQKTGDDTYTVVVSTASPFKFASSVLKGVAGRAGKVDPWQALASLSELSGWEIPRGLQGLTERPVQHADRCEPADITVLLAKNFGI